MGHPRLCRFITYTCSVLLAVAVAAGAWTQGGTYSHDPKFVQQAHTIANPLGLDPGTQLISRVIFCHGKIYYADFALGQISVLDVDDSYTVIDEKVLVTVPPPSSAILGLACDPRDSDDDFKLYFSHSLYRGGSGPHNRSETFVPYTGSVSYIKPNDENITIEPVIRNLGVSFFGLAVNCLAFRNDGKLLVCSGAMTNTGMGNNTSSGFLFDGPLNAAILAADIHNQNYNGTIEYAFLDSAPQDIKASHSPQDMRVADWVQSTNPYIRPSISGARNPYGLIVNRWGSVTVSDNGPSADEGVTMTGIDSNLQPIAGPDVVTIDGVWVNILPHCYLGHPNLARCRAGYQRSCTFVSMDTQSSQQVPSFCPPTFRLQPAATGMLEYSSFAFGGAYNGHLFISNFMRSSTRYDPVTRCSVADQDSGGSYPTTKGVVDLVQAPGGVHLAASIISGSILFNIPQDDVLRGTKCPSVYDIVPDRAGRQQSGPNTFVIGGENFDYIEDTVVVEIGGAPAANVTVQGRHWITGYIPTNLQGCCTTDVTVKIGATVLTMPNSFCYLR